MANQSVQVSRMLAWAMSTSLCLMMMGCGSTHSIASQRDAYSNQPKLLAPELVGNRQVTQVVRGAFGGKEMSINSVVSINGKQLSIVGLTAMGVRVFTLHFDGDTLQVDHDVPTPSQLTPERLLSDVQLVYWPLDALQKAYSQAGMELTQPFSGTRRLRANGRILAEVHYAADDPWLSRSWLVSVEHGYTLAIDSKAVESR